MKRKRHRPIQTQTTPLGKYRVTFHQKPEHMPREALAMLILVLADADEFRQKWNAAAPETPDRPHYPKEIHVVVEFNGIRACGTVSPEDGGEEVSVESCGAN